MSSEPAAGHVLLPWRTLALTSLIVALAFGATLVIIVSVKDVDTLSTVALTLAVLAFVVQIIVFVIQIAASNEQLRKSQELHSQMMSTLAQLQERTQGTQQSVERMNTRLLDAALGKAAGEGLTIGSPEYTEQVVRSLESSETRSRTGGDATSVMQYPPPLALDLASRVSAEMRSWPSADEVPEIEKVLGSLGEREERSLARYAGDVLAFSDPLSTMGPGLTFEVPPELFRLRLLEPVPNTSSFTLSSEGRRVARVLTAVGPAPEYIPEHLRELRMKHKEEVGGEMADALARARHQLQQTSARRTS